MELPIAPNRRWLLRLPVNLVLAIRGLLMFLNLGPLAEEHARNIFHLLGVMEELCGGAMIVRIFQNARQHRQVSKHLQCYVVLQHSI